VFYRALTVCLSARILARLRDRRCSACEAGDRRLRLRRRVHFFLLLLLLEELPEDVDEPELAFDEEEELEPVEEAEVSDEPELLSLEPDDEEEDESSDEEEDDVSVDEEEEPPERFCCSIQFRRSAVNGPTLRPEWSVLTIVNVDFVSPKLSIFCCVCSAPAGGTVVSPDPAKALTGIEATELNWLITAGTVWPREFLMEFCSAFPPEGTMDAMSSGRCTAYLHDPKAPMLYPATWKRFVSTGYFAITASTTLSSSSGYQY